MSLAARLDDLLCSVDALLRSLSSVGDVGEAAAQCLAGSAALRFHVLRAADEPTALVVLGGTGTGKSTLVNRLVQADVSAASIRRTFTAGPIAVTERYAVLPAAFLGLPHKVGEAPARGEGGFLTIVECAGDLTKRLVLLDTPDLDGDHPVHHALADRVFRWADAALFVVTPEKYQMPELLGYYRLALRYAVPSLFVMNKVEEQPAVEDYAHQLAARGYDRATIFAVPRDDAGYEPPSGTGMEALRAAVAAMHRPDAASRELGLRHRSADLAGQIQDKLLALLLQQRRSADALVARLEAIAAPTADVNVNPLTEQLARRLRERSILYLIGPQRILDRARQLPAIVKGLPRLGRDLLLRRKGGASADDKPQDERAAPDFRAVLEEQLATLQADIARAIRADAVAAAWITAHGQSFEQMLLPPSAAGVIADEELAALARWLEERWNASPRDTALFTTVLRHLPGGERIIRWSETAPYLLTIVLVTHHAFFGPVDLALLAAYAMGTFLIQQVTDEVKGQARQTNVRIAMRFARVAQEQVRRACEWIQRQAPRRETIDRLAQLTEQLGSA